LENEKWTQKEESSLYFTSVTQARYRARVYTFFKYA